MLTRDEEVEKETAGSSKVAGAKSPFLSFSVACGPTEVVPFYKRIQEEVFQQSLKYKMRLRCSRMGCGERKQVIH